MTTARDIMTKGATCAQETDTLADVAKKMKELQVGALPIRGAENRLTGMVTDRDIVVNCVAEGGNPADSKAADLARGNPVTIGADDSVEQALDTMTEHSVRRLPVMDGPELVGMLSQADIAIAAAQASTGSMVGAISQAPANN